MKRAVAQRSRLDNPAESVGKALPKQESKVQAHRKALPYTVVARCVEARASRAWSATKRALEFFNRTGIRLGDVRGARLDEIDMGAAVRETPVSRMTMKRPHRMPLSARALNILREAEAFHDRFGRIFPSARSKALSDMTLSKLVKALGFDADVHGFRTSFRTWAQECTNFHREVAEAALARAEGDAVKRPYPRSELFE